MKRASAMLLAALMCLTLGMTAMAAPSPGGAAATDKDGNAVDLWVSQDVYEVSESTVEDLKKDVSQVVPGLSSDWKLVGNLWDVWAPGVSKDNPVTITFTVPGVKDGDRVQVIHLTGGKWEIISAENLGKQQVRAKFTSLSPVGFVVKPASDSGKKSSSHSSSEKEESRGGSATGESAINNTPVSVTVNGEGVPVTSLRVLSDIPEVQRVKNRVAASGLGVIAPSLAGQTLVGLYDVTLDGYTGGQTTITFSVPGVKAGDVVTVIQYVDYADEWKLITPNSVGDGTVTVTFTSLTSPVGFVVNRAAAAAGVTSPKTGE